MDALGLIRSLALGALAAGAAAAEPHPLDPLDANELGAVVRLVAESGRFSGTALLADVSLEPPPKAGIIKWKEGAPFARRARATLRIAGETVEAVADLRAGDFESWGVVPGVQPRILSGEWSAAEAALKRDPRWRAAMALRGLEDPTEIFCDSLSAGFLDDPALDARRLIRMPCFLIEGARTNVYARPIEGVIGLVDLDRFEVVEVSDTGVVPIPVERHELPTHPPAPASGRADAVEVRGRMIRWEDWSFHLGFDARFGVVLSLVDHHAGGAPRRVLYAGHVSEVFVPYMDADPNWSWRTYLDAGEYGLGVLSSPLAPGIDCPADARFFGADQVNASGRVYRRENAICVFERALSDPLWRHHEGLTSAHAGQPARELVVRSIASVAHYDYVFDWTFTLSGEIRVAIGATGIDSVKVVDPAAFDTAGAPGTLVAPGLLAVFHDHHFSVRLDLDVDGPTNRFVRHRMKRLPIEDRRSRWALAPEIVATEGPVDHEGAEVWRVENPARRNAHGQPVAYEIHGRSAVSALDAGDAAQRRAGFSAHPLWITRHRPGERAAAGRYPNQSPGGEGLPRYADSESAVGADLVVWATVGFNHVTRAEDWPVLPVVWKGLTLRPAGFFDRNPAFD